MATDKETFPVSVVNYPFTFTINFPPMLDELEDQVFYINETSDPTEGVNVYQVLGIDHNVHDIFSLTYECTLTGSVDYLVGPFQQSIIHPTSGLIAFTPLREGTLQCIITVEDPGGMYSIREMSFFCRHRFPDINHPPIVVKAIDSQQTIRAGQLLITDEMEFIDSDDDELHWSCNIGAIGENGVYTFQSQYPGYYSVQITAYDIRGGAVTTEFVIHVLPWWAY